MIFGVREKLFLVSLVLIVVVGVTVGTYLENALRGWTEGRIEAELLRHARTVRELVEQTGADKIADADPVADRSGETTSAMLSAPVCSTSSRTVRACRRSSASIRLSVQPRRAFSR